MPRMSLLLACMVAASISTGSLAVAADAGNVVEVLVPRVTIYPGDVIGDGMLKWQRVPRDAAPAALLHRSTETLVGHIAKRTLIAGHPVPIDAVRLPHVILQGQRLTLVLETPGLLISAEGEASRSAATNEVLDFRNIDTGIVVRARVKDARTAVVEER